VACDKTKFIFYSQNFPRNR